MPVDKAWEEHIKTLKIFSAKFTDGTFEKLPMQSNNIMYDMKKDDFTAGYQAGQKSLSPEVRDVLEAIAKPERVLSVTSITYLRCRFCHKTGAIGDSIEHENFCTVPNIEKLLAKK